MVPIAESPQRRVLTGAPSQIPRFRRKGDTYLQYHHEPLNGGVSKREGFPIWTCPFFCPFLFIFCPCLSFRDFPDLSGIFDDFWGDFPNWSWPINFRKSTYEEQSQKGPSTTQSGPFRRNGKPPGLASPNIIKA